MDFNLEWLLKCAARVSKYIIHDFFFQSGVQACGTQNSGAVLKTRLCGPTGILNIQTDQTVTLNSVCGKHNYLIILTFSYSPSNFYGAQF